MTVPLALHKCVESSNPRNAGFCACGRRVFSGPRRDRRFEVEIRRQLLSGANFDPSALNVYAGQRADKGSYVYGEDFPSADRLLNAAVEGMDESSDGVNYMTWWLDAYNRGMLPDSEHWKAQHFQQALRYFALAFNECHQAS